MVKGEGDVALTGQLLLPIKMCRAIVNACAEQHRWPKGWVFDGKKNIYCPGDIFGRKTQTYRLSMGDERRSRNFEVSVHHASVIDMHTILRYHDRGDIALPKDAIQSLEVRISSFHENPSLTLES